MNIEEPIRFKCGDKHLYGILHSPEKGHRQETIVNMVIGGPQTRVGSHRLYVQLARFLCSKGITVLRFDYQGLGDSQGEFVGFQFAGPSIDASVHYIRDRFPDVTNLVLWSLCDGSSASVIYASDHHEFVSGLILCNPYTVIDEHDLSRIYLRHYYANRILSLALWKKIVTFRFKWRRSLQSLAQTVQNAFKVNVDSAISTNQQNRPSIPIQVCKSILDYPNRIVFLLGTEDLAAKNFLDVLSKQRMIKERMVEGSIHRHFIRGADHTFSDPIVKIQLFETTLTSIKEIESS